MRILAVRGRNLASLGDPFEVNLAAGPLATAGLFAITGETGAGKSTILDALCLALYATCPRLEADGLVEPVPDGAEREIRSDDPRSILRRGAADGFAEVDYVGVDGVGYRARWGVRRARGKSDGTLQAADRELRRIADDAVLETQKTLVDARVVETTGLSFDEFCRTVLLPQGGFDALLRADAKDRAALLEKITGTAVYREISRRVYARAADAEREVRDLETRRAEHRILTEEERDGLVGEGAGLAAEVEADAARRRALEADIARHDRIASERERLSVAEAALASARGVADAAAPDRDRLGALRRAEPLRLPFERARTARAEAEAAQRAEGAASEGRTLAADAVARAAEVRREAEAALAEAERVLAALDPEWTRATRLDAEVAAAAEESRKAASARDSAMAEADVAEADAGAAEAALAESLAARDAAAASVASLAPLRPLADRHGEVAARLERRAALVEERARRAGEAASLEAERARDRETLAALEAADGRDRSRRDEVAGRVAERAEALRAVDEQDLAARGEALAALGETLGDLARAARDHAAAEAEARAAEARAAEAAGEEAASLALVEAAERDLDAARRVAETLAAPLAVAEDAATPAAAAMRARLEPGLPCPVCGSTDHPSHAEAGLAAVLDDLRARRQDAVAREAEARDRKVAALSRRATAAARAGDAREARVSADARAAAALASWSSARSAVAPLEGIGAGLPDTPDPGAVDEDLARVAAAVREVGEARRRAAALRDERDRLAAERDALTAAIESRAAERTRLSTALAKAGEAAALARQAADDAARRVWDLDADLAPLIAPAGLIEADLDRDPAGAAAVAARAAERVRAAVAALAEGEERVGRAGPAAGEARSRAAALAGAARRLAAEAEARAAGLAARRAERAALLGGEETDVHRGRHLRAADDRRRAAGEAREAAAAAERAFAGAEEAWRQASGRASAAAEALAAAEADLAAGSSAAGYEAEALAGLLSAGADEVEALEGRIAAIDRALREAAAVALERRGDLEAALAAGAPEVPREDLVAGVALLDARQRVRQERLGAIAERLARDDEARATLAGLDAALADARARAAVWGDVNRAVGAADGSRFARIAQGVTLDLLVELANGHLAGLKPRYRLARAPGGDLGLNVIDSDMGGEARSTRSLSGGERFLVSLSLALALSGLGGRQTFADTLFIDEGFGSLDEASLDIAIDALERLQGQGRTVGVISHVEAMKERIPVQVRVVRQGPGRSAVRVAAPDGWDG